jgi:hypothetical protein
VTARGTAPATGPGDPFEYDIAAALATHAASLADAIDDNRPDWREHADSVRDALDWLVAIKPPART